MEMEFIYFAAADYGSSISQPYRPDLNDLHIEVPPPHCFTAVLQREARLKGARLAHYCACLCNDWSSAGLQAGIGWQAHRNSDYSEVVTFVVVVVVVLAMQSPPAHCLRFQSW